MTALINDKEELTKKNNLSAEVGRYFTPKGKFNEELFRKSLHKTLINFKENQIDKKSFSLFVSQWMTSYLTEILDYLEKKGLPEASFRLFKAAIEESSRMGIQDVIISADHLKHLLSCVTPGTITEDKKTMSDAKRKKIFSAAIEVFGQKGYYNATIDEIAALSGIGKGSVYRYFKSKKELLSQLLKEKYDEIIDKVSQIFSREHDILMQIQEMIEFWINFIEENPILYRLIQAEDIYHKGEDLPPFYDYIIDRLPMFKERILALNLEKRLKTTNFYTVFYGILGFIDGVAQKWFRKGMDYPLRDEIPVILEVLFNGFVGETKSNKSFMRILKKTVNSIKN